jgi:hypothetical protein
MLDEARPAKAISAEQSCAAKIRNIPYSTMPKNVCFHFSSYVC